MEGMKTIYNTDDNIYNDEDMFHAFSHAYYLGKAPREYKVEYALSEWKKEYCNNTTKELTLDAIINAVAWRTGTSAYHIAEMDHKPLLLSRARQYVCFIAYHYTRIPLRDIAIHTRAGNHSTVLHRARDLGSALAYEKNTQKDIETIKAFLYYDRYSLEYHATRNPVNIEIDTV